MAPKKAAAKAAPAPKAEEKPAISPEEALPPGFSLGCQVFWVGNSVTFDDGEIVKCGVKGRLAAVNELSATQTVEFVELEVQEGVTHKVPLQSLALEPPGLDKMDELPTGLQLPLRGEMMVEIWDAQDPVVQSAMLTRLLGLDKAYPNERQREIVSDFHLFSVRQAQAICLSSAKAAVFVAVMAEVLALARGEPRGHGTADEQSMDGLHSCSECFQEFRRLLLMHAHEDPPLRCGIFTPSDVKLLTDFTVSTFFRHFTLYQFCATFANDPPRLRCSATLERPGAPLKLQFARLKPKPKPTSQEGKQPSMDDAAVLDEEEEIERQVQERLRHTEKVLQARLQEREEAFMKRIEEAKKAAAPKAKGKK
eukprot:TRINITY_DN11857_c0_g1_i1.p1 TRINITY_DN11857_c0_g1~~TRINITY_DN11857_c0_g1_i1.p1  ORF type:complete len:404 (-),score=80.96 TRINITY_DN11857_c0_g1_i1:214-1311(-)